MVIAECDPMHFQIALFNLAPVFKRVAIWAGEPGSQTLCIVFKNVDGLRSFCCFDATYPI